MGGFESYHGASGENLVTCVSGNPTLSACVQASYPVGQWNHLPIRYAGSSTQPGGGGDFEIYLGGALAATIPNPAGDVIFSSGQANAAMVGQHSNFAIDELSVYNSVFEPEDQCAIVIGGTWSSGTCVLP